MGFFKKVFKPIKKIFKPITKIVKKVAKKVKKIGKAVMKGVSKFSTKLGPIGMIAMSIAMPYALAGLSTATTAAYTSSNVFLKAVGTIGNQIRLGYQAFNTAMSLGKKSITDIIGKTFEKFAPKGGTNIFSRISDGAKRLYTAGQNKLKSMMPKPLTAQGGTVTQIDSGFLTNNAVDPGINVLSSTDAAKYIQSNQQSFLSAGKNVASEFSNQTLSQKGGWFTKTNAAGIDADTIVSDVINDAYKTRLDGFGENAKRMFNDIRNKALEMDTYINDEQIGSFVENNNGASSFRTDVTNYSGSASDANRFKITTEIPNLGTTGDYSLVGPIEGGGDAANYVFNGNNTFGKQPATANFFQNNSKKLKNLTKSLLNSSGTSPIESAALPLSLDTSPIDMAQSTYGGTDIKGSEGGTLVAAYYGQRVADMLRYTGNMNALNSGEKFST